MTVSVRRAATAGSGATKVQVARPACVLQRDQLEPTRALTVLAAAGRSVKETVDTRASSSEYETSETA
jgi:mRNA-degrading endonuclease toxin of MazEF toxin-antitoxin module